MSDRYPFFARRMGLDLLTLSLPSGELAIMSLKGGGDAFFPLRFVVIFCAASTLGRIAILTSSTLLLSSIFILFASTSNS